jgi:hypothetical protein
MSQFNKYLEIIQEMKQSQDIQNVNLKTVDLAKNKIDSISKESLKDQTTFMEIKDNKNLSGYKALYDGKHAVITNDFKTYHIFKEGKTSLTYVISYDNTDNIDNIMSVFKKNS